MFRTMNKDLFEKFKAETLDLNDGLSHTGGANTNASWTTGGGCDVCVCTDANGTRNCFTYEELPHDPKRL